eukprot:1908047-Pyramimonas_sp.AAC.1
MGSGLVGSEMCIRDRRRRRWGGVEREGLGVGGGGEGGGGGWKLRRRRCCLLYTSDAADDTPCVDL